jgi:outer membrane protein OmpA-like peptidoglycan-associated protein
MDLDSSTHEIIKHDSVASIETEGLLGNQYLAISFGSAGQSDVREGDFIQSEPPLQMADLLTKASGILSSSQVAIGNVSQATAHLNSVSAKIDSGQGSVGALINDKELYSNLQRSTGSLNQTLVQAQAGVTDFRENMEALKQNFLLKGYFKKRGYEDSEELAAHAIDRLPQGAPAMAFTYLPKQLFGGHDSFKLQNQKSLNEGGDYLAKNPFGFAVVVVSSGLEGDSQKELELTEVRAIVIRKYLVEHFAFDDGQIRTLGLGKQSAATSDAGSGSIQLLIFPVGSEVPASEPTQAGVASKATIETPAQAKGGGSAKP